MTITAKDLTQEFPRSPFEQLGGLPWLARMIDKTRALNAGKIGDYTPFPCGGDKNFLASAGLDADAFKAQVDAGRTDEEILAWVQAQMPAEAADRLAAYRARQLQPLADPEMLGYLEGAKADLAKQRPELDVSKIDNWARLICVEEGHPIPSA